MPTDLRQAMPVCSCVHAPLVAHLYESGLAPIAWHLSRQFPAGLPKESIDLLHGADLTARAIHGSMSNATTRILDAADGVGIPVTLLKGISVADEIYALPHHRLMGDVDLLVHARDIAAMCKILDDQGFSQGTGVDAQSLSPDHHHLPEHRHRETGISVELHTRLVPHRSRFHGDALLDPITFCRETLSSNYRGHTCRRFTPEYQLLYTLAHWSADRKWSVSLVGLVDATLILRKNHETLDWSRIARWMRESPLFAERLALLLLFLARHELATIHPGLVTEIYRTKRQVGRVNLAMLHWLLLEFPVSGRRRAGFIVSRRVAQVLWDSLLEPMPAYQRPVAALSNVLLRAAATLRPFRSR